MYVCLVLEYDQSTEAIHLACALAGVLCIFQSVDNDVSYITRIGPLLILIELLSFIITNFFMNQSYFL